MSLHGRFKDLDASIHLVQPVQLSNSSRICIETQREITPRFKLYFTYMLHRLCCTNYYAYVPKLGIDNRIIHPAGSTLLFRIRRKRMDHRLLPSPDY